MPNETRHHHPQPFFSSQYWVYMGFAIGLGLGIAALIFGLQQRQNSLHDINYLVENQMAKAHLLSQMRIAARERTICLFHMVNLTDPFEQDKWFLEFTRQGAIFAEARDILITLPHTEHEDALIKRQSAQSNLAVPNQVLITDMVQQNQTRQAYRLLIEQAVPQQNKVINTLNQYHDYIADDIDTLLAGINTQQNQAYNFIFILRVVAAALTIMMAIYALRKITASAKELYLENELAQVTLSSIGDGVITTDADSHIQFMNTEAEKLTGWTLAEVTQLPLMKILRLTYRDSQKLIANPVSKAIASNQCVNLSSTTTLTDRNKQKYAIELTANAIRDDHSNIHGGIVVLRDVSENRALTEQLSYQASHDALTGLVNRREFEIRLQQAINNSKTERTECALIYLDLDQFKIINDMSGHLRRKK